MIRKTLFKSIMRLALIYRITKIVLLKRIMIQYYYDNEIIIYCNGNKTTILIMVIRIVRIAMKINDNNDNNNYVIKMLRMTLIIIIIIIIIIITIIIMTMNTITVQHIVLILVKQL